MAYVQIDKQAFIKNINTIIEKVGRKEAVAIVLKDNAYGHGLQSMAQLSCEQGIAHAVVRNVMEAKQIASQFSTIMILAPERYEAVENFYYVVNAIETLEAVPAACNIELKVDTGMHRNGIALSELPKALAIIQARQLRLAGVLSHHRSADELGSAYFWQEHHFQAVKKEVTAFCQTEGMPIPRFHNKNSAALFRANTLDDDLVRIGIAAYGLLRLPSVFTPYRFWPVMSLVATCNSCRTLETGEALGYGGTFIAPQRMQVGNYDIGYADGMMRTLSNRYETPSGALLLGRVSMDNSSFNTTDDALIVFNDANHIADAAQTLAYEVLVSMNPNLKRCIV